MKKKKADTDIPEEPRPTIWDVAKRSGVSTATVSRVLNGQAYVAEETRDKVLDVVRELSYVSNRHSFVQSNASPTLIGLTAVSMRIVEYTEIVAGVTEELHTHNARPVVCPLARRHNCGMSLLERLMYKTTDGGLVLGPTESEEDLLEVQASGFPFVVINPTRAVGEAIPVVATSDWHSARTATEHLLALEHRRIAIIIHRNGIFHSADRLAGLQSALLTAGIPLMQEYIYEGEGNAKSLGEEATRHFLSLPLPPTAIVAVNDAIAVGVLHAAHECHYEIPAQLSVIGFDDLELASMTLPALTTMHQPYMEMGRVGVDMLYRLIDGRPLDATRVELTARLVIRGTTAGPR